MCLAGQLEEEIAQQEQESAAGTLLNQPLDQPTSKNMATREEKLKLIADSIRGIPGAHNSIIDYNLWSHFSTVNAAARALLGETALPNPPLLLRLKEHTHSEQAAWCMNEHARLHARALAP